MCKKPRETVTHQPSYLGEHINDYVPAETLRSSSKIFPTEPYFRLNTSWRTFRYVATITWNNIPNDMKTIWTWDRSENILNHFYLNSFSVAVAECFLVLAHELYYIKSLISRASLFIYKLIKLVYNCLTMLASYA